MSQKTLRLDHDSAITSTTKRSAQFRVRLCAYAVALLVSTPATALELGEAALRSGLGQALRVEIPYRLAADEQLTAACIAVVPAAQAAGGLPDYSRVDRVAVTPTHIEIFGGGRVLDPLIGLTVDVRCRTVPRFLRSYALFVDPPDRLPGTAFGPARVAAARSEAAAAPSAGVSARARGQSGEPLTQGQAYVVVRGDTLSGIAARVSERPATIRETAEAIFAANSDAFSRGNRDLIEAGRTITIPIMAPAASVPQAPRATPALPETRDLATVTAASSTSTAPPAEHLAPTVRASPPPAAASPVSVPRVAEPGVAAFTAAASNELPVATTAETPSLLTRVSLWLTALLALGAVVALSTPLWLLRRREHEPPVPAAAKPRASQPRRIVDPAAGFEVVEEPLRAPSSAANGSTSKHRTAATSTGSLAATGTEPLRSNSGTIDAVDLDIGAPIADERVDWFGDGDDRAAIAAAPDPTLESASTALMPELESTLASQPPLASESMDEPTIDDQQHTLTIAELELLRQDYEAEHTLTQEANQALRDALADLKATQAAARAANVDTATFEVPEPSSETSDTLPARKLRSSR
jgi:hypothetical protein